MESPTHLYIEDGTLRGHIHVTLNDLIGKDLESTLDLMSQRLTGTELLSDITYSVCGHSYPDVVILEIKGDPALALDSDDCFPRIKELWDEWRKKHG